MQIEIDKDMLQERINSVVAESVSNSDYKIKMAIEDTLVNSLVQKGIPELIDEAVKKVDSEKLVNTLSQEILKSMTGSIVHIIRDSFLETLCKIKGIGNYSDEDKKERAILKAKIWREHGNISSLTTKDKT